MTTYAELTTQIQDWAEYAEATFVAEIPVFIANAELRIYRSVDLNTARKEDATIALVDGTISATLPTDLVTIHSVALLISGARTLLLQKDKSYIDDYSGNRTTTGTPKYYAWDDDVTIYLGPTPDATAAAGTLAIEYTFRPTGLSASQTTTWLSLNAPDVLFYACQWEAAIFLKLEVEALERVKEAYNLAVKGLLMEENARNRTDSYRDGEIRMGK